MLRRSASHLLRQLSSQVAGQGSSVSLVSRALPIWSAESNPLASGGYTQLVSCADFTGSRQHGAWSPGMGRGFSSEALPDSDGTEQLESSGLDAQSIVDTLRFAEIDALAAANEDAWLPTRGLQSLLSTVHESLDVSWVTAIAATTVGARLLMAPVVVKQMKNTARMSKARPELEQLMNWYKEQQASGTASPDLTKEYQMRMLQIWDKYDCNPGKSMLPLLVQAPVFICFFAGLRHMAAAKVPSMVEGGMLWFPDLTVADPTYMLPILTSLTFLATVELGAADGMQGQPESTLQKMKMFMRGLAVLLVPLTASMPANVFVYWTTSNIFSLFQTLAFKPPAVRTFLGLPPLGAAAGTAAPGATPTGPVKTFSSRPATHAAKPRPAASRPISAEQLRAAAPKIYDVEPQPAPPSNSSKKGKRKRR